MKELSSQVSKYDRELALNKKQKELQAASKANGSMSESMQIHKGHGNSIMKRRKRKRHEENLDIPLYIKKHQILSYYHDKQNKGAEADGLLIDDDCGSTVPIRGGLDSVTLLDSENYDVIFEQLSLKNILLSIDAVQSRVHLLQGHLSKAHYEGRNLAFSEGNTHVRVPQKRQHTQKRSSYTECRYTKPQKKKNLNVLLKDDNGPALSGRPCLPDRETDTQIKDANRVAEERSGECKHLREKAITVDLLLGIGNSIPNGYIEDLCKENADDILIDNQATSDVCQQFNKAKHLPSGTSSKEQNISAPVEVKNTCAPVKVDTTCAPVEVGTTCALAVGQQSSFEKSASKEPLSSGSKQEPNSKKKRRKKGSLFTRRKQRNEPSKTPTAKEKTEGTPSAANTQTESTSSAVAKKKTKGTCSAATGPQTMTPRSAGKKCKSVNEPSDAKEHGSVNSFSALMEQKNGKPSSAMKRKEASKTPAAKEKTEGTPSAANTQTESMPSAVAKQKTEGTRSAATGLETMTARSARKKRKSINEPADAKEHGSGNSFLAWTEHKTWKPSSAVKKQKTEKLSTAAKKHGSGNSSSESMEQTIGMLFSAVKRQKTETLSTAAKKHGSGNKSSASMEQKTGKPSSAAKKQKTETSSTAAKEHGPGNSTSALKEQKAGKGSSAVKKLETDHSSAAANKQEAESVSSVKKKQATESSSSKAKKAETAASAPSKLQVEKAMVVAVDRRSQRVRKPKVFAE